MAHDIYHITKVKKETKVQVLNQEGGQFLGTRTAIALEGEYVVQTPQGDKSIETEQHVDAFFTPHRNTTMFSTGSYRKIRASS